MRSDRLEQLYSEMGGMIYRRCLRMLGDKEEARVGVQEVFLRFMMSLSTADGTAVKRVNLDLLFFENRWQSGRSARAFQPGGGGRNPGACNEG